jgi:GntR family transcriptional regulator/MocR family aminotransferase
MQGLTLVCRALVRAGASRVAVEDPCHVWHRAAIEATGLEPVPIAVDERGLDPADLPAEAVDAVLVAPAHSYPSGATLSGARRQELVAWADRNRALVIEDDYDAELRYDRTPLGALQGLGPEHVIHIGSASKALTPALRLGWLVAPPRLITSLAREKHHDDMGSSLLDQLALARFIATGAFSRHLRHVRPIYRDRRDATISALASLLPDARWRGEAAGLHVHITLPEHVDEAALARVAYENGALIEAGAWHWATPEDAPPSFVLGYGSATGSEIRRGLGVVADAVGKAARRSRVD